ncbi:MAG: putative hydrolase or acyltransferase of alpha/beta superfamily [Rhizobacter sp.]|nr:putative hydrolase or acyltransferase of alpha/beta superfamily [Rhizobacter sp.]
MRRNLPLPLLLLPGLMNDERVWDPIRQALPAGRTVVVAETHTADSISALAASALSLMPAGPFAVAGFSLGGYVALEVCRQAFERVAGVALLDTGARADSEEAKDNRRRMVAALGAGTASLAQVASGFAARIIHPSHAQDAQMLELLADMARAVGSEGFVRQQTAAMNRQDSRQLLAELRCPALVLCGREDQVTPPALSEELSSLLAGDVELVVIPECGHMSTLERPTTVTEAFNRWIDRADRSQQAARTGA